MRILNEKNIIGLVLCIIIISISILVPFSCKISPNEETTTKEKSGSALIFLIPSDFNGTMRIVDDQSCGQKIKVVDGKREIEIPRNGILIVRDTLLARWTHEFFLVDNEGRRTSIPDITHAVESNDTTSVGVKFIAHGGIGTLMPDSSYSFLDYTELLVSNPGHSAINMDEDKFGVLTSATVDSCRLKIR